MKVYYESKPGELEHGIFGTTKKKKNAKYIAKIPIGNGKYRYFYSQQELKAYNAAKKINKAVKNTVDDVKNTVDDVNNKLMDVTGRKYYNEADKYAKKAKKLEEDAEILDKRSENLLKKAIGYSDALNKEKNSISGRIGTKKSKEKQNDLFTKMINTSFKSAGAIQRKDIKETHAKNNRYYESLYRKEGDDSFYGLIQKMKKKKKKKKKKKN